MSTIKSLIGKQFSLRPDCNICRVLPALCRRPDVCRGRSAVACSGCAYTLGKNAIINAKSTKKANEAKL